MAKRTKTAEFLEHVEKIKQLFAKADKAKLERALKSGNLSEICKVLGVSEKELKEFLKKGRKLALSFLPRPFRK